MSENKSVLQNRINKNLRLMEERRNILILPPEKALDAILNSNAPATLVQSFPEEDLYMLINDIGVEDALPVLSIASSDQWKFILDIEVWNKDRVDHLAFTKWLDLLNQAEPKRTLNFLFFENLDLFELHLNKYIEVGIREHDQDPSDFGKEYFTLDDTYFIRFRDVKSDDPDEQKIIDYGKEVIVELFKTLSSMNHLAYQSLLHESMTVIPSETEEEDYRMKNVRLAEKGFLPYEDAISIYAPLSVDEIKKRSAKIFPGIQGEVALNPVPMYSFGMVEKENNFAGALSLIESDELLLNLQVEFANLCNQLISAEQKKIREKEELKEIVKKACNFISIGLERIDDKDNVRVITKNTLTDIFRTGYTFVADLKNETASWFKNSWFKKMNLSPTFFGEDIFGHIGGILLPRPMFFDNYKTGVLYRDFENVSEIEFARTIIDEIKGFDLVYSLIEMDNKILTNENLNFKNLLLTLWACNYLNKDKKQSMEVEDLRKLFKDMFKSGKVQLSIKENFLNFLIDSTGLSAMEISEKMGQSLEKLFNEIESEYGSVADKDVDSRYIDLFLVE